MKFLKEQYLFLLMKNEKQGAFVWNTVVTAETPGYTYTLTNIRMRKIFCNTLAYLLEHDLLKKKHLIFLTDGAKDIRRNIEEVSDSVLIPSF